MKPATPIKNHNFIAEITQSSLSHLTAQCLDSQTFLPFGSIVAIATPSRTFFGAIANITTGPTEPHRKPTTFGLQPDELQRQQPQIFNFIQTSLEIILLGSAPQDEIPTFTIPPHPPILHSLVRPATKTELKIIASTPQSLQQILCLQNLPLDKNELLLAIFRNLSKVQTITPDFIGQFYDLYATLCQMDSRQTRLFLRRLQGSINLSSNQFTKGQP